MVTTMKTAALWIVALLFALLIPAKAGNVLVTWDAPAQPAAILVEGYNVYEVTFTPPVAPPKPAAEANIPSPVAGAVGVYRKLNTTLIPATTLEFRINDYRSGTQLVIRGANFMGESPDSDVLTLHSVPVKPSGVKAVAVILESSTDLKSWAPFAVVYTVANVANTFFRLDIK